MKRLALHSVPRSGSTWLGAIFNSSPQVLFKYQPLFSYALKSALDENSSPQQIRQFFQNLQAVEDDFIDQVQEKQKGIVPDFQKQNITTLVYKEVRYHHILENMLLQEPEVKIVGLVRNPLATISSWLKAPKEFRPDLGWKMEEEWRYAPKKNQSRPEEFNGYEKWKEVALLFERLKNLYPDRFFLLNYSSLLADTLGEVEKLFEFSGLPLTSQTLDFINHSTSRSIDHPYGVFRQKATSDNQWVDDLPAYIVSEITEDLRGSVLEKYLRL